MGIRSRAASQVNELLAGRISHLRDKSCENLPVAMKQIRRLFAKKIICEGASKALVWRVYPHVADGSGTPLKDGGLGELLAGRI